MTRSLALGLLSLCLCLMCSACAPPSAVLREDVVTLPPVASSSAPVQAADLAPSAATNLPDLTITGNLPLVVTKEAGALDSCNADKDRVRKALKLPPC